MKSPTYYSFIILFLLAFSACKEVPPGINYSPDAVPTTDTTNIATQKHNVLLEEITGVRCVNCPAGHIVGDNIASSHPAGQVSVVAIHAGQYAIPYSFSSNDDLEIAEGTAIYNLLGQSSQYPCAAINRTGAQSSKFLSPASIWAGYVNNELLDTLTKVKIGLVPSYNSTTRQLNLSVNLYYTQTVTTGNNLSVMITENGIIDAQEVPPSVAPSGIDTFYNQRHVLRGMLTPFNGQTIAGTKAPGSPIGINLSPFTIPPGWNADSCTIIAFVTEGTDSVLQVVNRALKK